MAIVPDIKFRTGARALPNPLPAPVIRTLYFSHLFIHEDDRDKYHQSMVMAALSILKNPSGDL